MVRTFSKTIIALRTNWKKIINYGVCFCGVSLLGSCAGQCNIMGDSSMSSLDGRMLYLKVLSNNEYVCNIDSCEVIHGKFTLQGNVDTITMGEIYMDNQGFMPIVIENGDISINISDSEQKVEGSTLNKRLYRFISQKNEIESEIMRSSQLEAHMILSGVHPLLAHQRVEYATDSLYKSLENLEAEFISHNCNNILGSTYFMMLTSEFPYPIMTAQIEKIMKHSSASFKKSPNVRNYINAARHNMRMMQEISRNKMRPLPLSH